MNEEEEMDISRHHPAYLWRAHQVKEYVESIMSEQKRALEMADSEREKAAAALRNEQQRALDQAEREREKAAVALRDQLSDRIAAGDTNLREHIAAQISQLTLMVHDFENIAEVRQEALRREMRIQHAADQAAIQKAEAANEARFAAANEWRGQSADRERTQQEQIASFVSTLTPLVKTESIEEKLSAVSDRNRSDIAHLTNRFDAREGQSTGARQSQASLYAFIGAAATLIGILVVVMNAWPR